MEGHCAVPLSRLSRRKSPLDIDFPIRPKSDQTVALQGIAAARLCLRSRSAHAGWPSPRCEGDFAPLAVDARCTPSGVIVDYCGTRMQLSVWFSTFKLASLNQRVLGSSPSASTSFKTLDSSEALRGVNSDEVHSVRSAPVMA